MEFLSSPLLARVPGFFHGFGTKVEGSRAEARTAAQDALSRKGRVHFLKQVHGCSVARPPWSEPPEADASMTNDAGSLLAIETADCLPVLIVDPVTRRVAAAHAGWRGTVAGVVTAVVRSVVDAGSKPQNLLVALGPSIGPCCYEVGDDVEAAFGLDGARYFSAGSRSKRHLDVTAANRDQLVAAGVDPSNIDVVKFCTRCRADLFFSYRRDGANAGRMISVAGFSRAAAS